MRKTVNPERDALSPSRSATKGESKLHQQNRSDHVQPSNDDLKPPVVTMEDLTDLLSRRVWTDDPDFVAQEIYCAVHFYRSMDNIEPHREELRQMGAHTICLGIMRKFSTHAKIQKGCCHLLILLLRHDVVERTSYIENIGAIETVLKALDLFRKDTVVQINSVFLLDEMFSRNQNVRDSRHYERFAKHDGVALLSAAMEHNPTVSRLQHSACHIIRLAGGADHDICRGFIEGGCIGFVAIAIQTFPDNDRLQIVAHDAMEVLMKSHQMIFPKHHETNTVTPTQRSERKVPQEEDRDEEEQGDEEVYSVSQKIQDYEYMSHEEESSHRAGLGDDQESREDTEAGNLIYIEEP